jgi:hypothetical protein
MLLLLQMLSAFDAARPGQMGQPSRALVNDLKRAKETGGAFTEDQIDFTCVVGLAREPPREGPQRAELRRSQSRAVSV